MHGVAITGFKEFVTDAYGEDAWTAVRTEAGLDPRIYVPVSDYPEVDAPALVAATSEQSGQPEADVWERFGRHVAPRLRSTFDVVVDESWSLADLLANAPAVVEETFELRQLGDASVPDLTASQSGEDRVRFELDAPEWGCAFATGLLDGVAAACDDPLAVVEPDCGGDEAACVLVAEVGTDDAASLAAALEAEAADEEGDAGLAEEAEADSDVEGGTDLEEEEEHLVEEWNPEGDDAEPDDEPADA